MKLVCVCELALQNKNAKKKTRKKKIIDCELNIKY